LNIDYNSSENKISKSVNKFIRRYWKKIMIKMFFNKIIFNNKNSIKIDQKKKKKKKKNKKINKKNINKKKNDLVTEEKGCTTTKDKWKLLVY